MESGGKLSPVKHKKTEARAAELIAEEMTLRELRHARKLTQVRVAKKLGITQDSVSRIEKRSDLLLSTLRKTVEAMGGTCPWWPNFLIVSRWSYLASLKTTRAGATVRAART